MSVYTASLQHPMRGDIVRTVEARFTEQELVELYRLWGYDGSSPIAFIESAVDPIPHLGDQLAGEQFGQHAYVLDGASWQR